jgi:hypothetical protein
MPSDRVDDGFRDVVQVENGWPSVEATVMTAKDQISGIRLERSSRTCIWPENSIRRLAMEAFRSLMRVHEMQQHKKGSQLARDIPSVELIAFLHGDFGERLEVFVVDGLFHSYHLHCEFAPI